MSIKKVDILKEFEKIDGKKGTYRMSLGQGESIVYQDGEYGTYWRKGNVYDQAPTWIGKEAAIQKATNYLIVINQADLNLAYFDGFEEYDYNFWK